MVLTLLLPLMASLQMLPRLVSSQVPNPAPQLTVSPEQPVYITGEAVTLTCSAAGTSTVSGIRFFRDDQEIEPKELLSPQYSYTNSIQLSGVSGAQAGNYSCESWKIESDGEITSERSQLISITVTDPLPAPQLTLSPQYPVYVTGEAVTLTCSAARVSTVSRVRFFRDNQIIHFKELPSPQYRFSDFLGLSGVSGLRARNYSCESWETVSGREIPSKRSRPISIAVTDPLPAPQLTVSPQYPVYVTGEAVTLTCSAARVSTVSRVRFFRDNQIIHFKELPSPHYRFSDFIGLSGVSGLQAGKYSCESWETVSGREIPSKRSRPTSIAVTAPLPAPKLTVFPQPPVYITGEAVTLTCSATGAPSVSGVRFFRENQKIQSKELPSPRYSYTESIRLSGGSGLRTGVYSCESWKTVSGQEIPSKKSPPISITVTDPPLQPALSVDPLSVVVSKGIHLLMTCTAPRDAGQRRFHFYKDRVELIPGDVGSEINTTEPRTVSVITSVLSIPRASSNNTGEFTCGYEEHVGGRWIPSPRSQAVTVTGNVTMSAQSFFWVRELVVGGSFFLINGLISLVSHCCL